MVSVLVFVNQDMAEATAVILGHLRVVLQKVNGLEDEVVEVEGVSCPQALSVGRVDLRNHAFPWVCGAGFGCELFGADQLVLEVRNTVAHHLGGELLGIKVHLLDDECQQALGISRVVDGEGRFKPQGFCLSAQYPHAERVEGRNPHALGPRPHQGCNALPHLGCGFIGEGNRQNLPLVGTARRQQIGNAVGQNAGLA